MDLIDAAWVAGLLEGEGSFGAQKGKLGSFYIQCQMTDEDVILKLQKIAGGTISDGPPKKDHWKHVYRWQLSGDRAVELVEKILPFLMSRRSKRIAEILEVRSEALRKREEKKQDRDRRLADAVLEYKAGNVSLRVLERKYHISRNAIMHESR